MDDLRCYWCEYDERGEPCRRDGLRDYDRMASAYVSFWEATTTGGTNEENSWIGDCVSELERDAPDAALYFILLALDAIRSADVLAVLAAGPMENVLSHRGRDIVTAIEEIARRSPKFRLLLSGSWGRNRMDEDVWRRASAAVGRGPLFCSDPRTLGHGGYGREASETEIEHLLATSAIDDLGGRDAARALIGHATPLEGSDTGRGAAPTTRR